MITLVFRGKKGMRFRLSVKWIIINLTFTIPRLRNIRKDNARKIKQNSWESISEHSQSEWNYWILCLWQWWKVSIVDGVLNSINAQAAVWDKQLYGQQNVDEATQGQSPSSLLSHTAGRLQSQASSKSMMSADPILSTMLSTMRKPTHCWFTPLPVCSCHPSGKMIKCSHCAR